MGRKNKKRKIASEGIELSDATTSNSATTTDPRANDRLGLAKLPPEIFDEIMSYFPILPSNFYTTSQDVHSMPSPKYSERTKVLRALSHSCRILRQTTFSRLWERLDTYFTPKRRPAGESRYKNLMTNLMMKAEGVLSSGSAIQGCIRILTFALCKGNFCATPDKLALLLGALPNLQTIHVVTLFARKARGSFTQAMSTLTLPSVRTLRVSSNTHSLIDACPNVTHVRCVGGAGASIVDSLKNRPIEILDGMFDWTNLQLVDRLIENAPGLKRLELRQRAGGRFGPPGHTAPPEWAEIIPKLSALPNLVWLQLTFVGKEKATDLGSIEAARKMMQNSKVEGVRKLVIRRVLRPPPPSEYNGDVVQSYQEEEFSTAL